MNKKEEAVFNELVLLVKDLKSENNKFREDINIQIETINNKVDKKHIPVNLEQDILKTAQLAMNDSIIKVLTDYSSPLKKLTADVINENSLFLKELISDSFNQVIRTDEFKNSIISAFSHKVARSIISNNDGLFDKVSNELKQDSVFKAKMALAVSNVIEECLSEFKNK